VLALDSMALMLLNSESSEAYSPGASPTKIIRGETLALSRAAGLTSRMQECGAAQAAAAAGRGKPDSHLSANQQVQFRFMADRRLTHGQFNNNNSTALTQVPTTIATTPSRLFFCALRVRLSPIVPGFSSTFAMAAKGAAGNPSESECGHQAQR